jgi:hypothetical protein
MYVCEGCGATVERKGSIGRMPKPPFCRPCYERERGLMRQQHRVPKVTGCLTCGEPLPRLRVELRKYCSEDCGAIAHTARIARYRAEGRYKTEEIGGSLVRAANPEALSH